MGIFDFFKRVRGDNKPARKLSTPVRPAPRTGPFGPRGSFASQPRGSESTSLGSDLLNPLNPLSPLSPFNPLNDVASTPPACDPVPTSHPDYSACDPTPSYSSPSHDYSPSPSYDSSSYSPSSDYSSPSSDSSSSSSDW